MLNMIKLLCKIFYFKYSYLKEKISFTIKRLRGVPFNDYLFFPFNTNDPLPHDALNIMKVGCDILDKLDVNYSLADGTLLGVYRDKKLIAHDTDIDVAVVGEVDITKIEKEFKRKGFKVGRKVLALGKIRQLVFYSQSRAMFDIIFYTQYGKNVYAFCEKDFYFKHQANHYEDLTEIEHNGFIYKIPQEPELWLEHVYGRDWNIPKSEKPTDWRKGENEYLTAVPYNGDLAKLVLEIKQNEGI